MIFQRISYFGFWEEQHAVRKYEKIPEESSYFWPVFHFNKNRPVSTCTEQPIASAGGCQQCSQPQWEKGWRQSQGLLWKKNHQIQPGAHKYREVWRIWSASTRKTYPTWRFYGTWPCDWRLHTPRWYHSHLTVGEIFWLAPLPHSTVRSNHLGTPDKWKHFHTCR